MPKASSKPTLPKPTPREPTPPDPTTPDPAPPYERDAILHENGPLDPAFMTEAIRTLMRTLPLDPTEPQPWQHRRMYSALLGLAALHPRDEIEVMLGVQAMAAYHAAAAGWHLGMNHHRPNGDSTRHITTAASAARAFDTMLRALERRQARPLAVPPGRPPPRAWTPTDPTPVIATLEERCRAGQHGGEPDHGPQPPIVWTPDELAAADGLLARARTAQEDAGLDIANTEGILPGGGMILPEHPTPQQQAYMGRRLGLMYQRQYAESLRAGSRVLPKLQPIRPGDLIP